ncbi:ABC transporter ATP-binding protein [Virgibacillus halodenitrificans]|uniref:ABC transporter ATP-binding protein n=1 Tax=Virgibacillus halodenitrificans TaxID=1482 RepID=UPI00045C9A51|nr:ABC transporter ATP-binding protein [Virgibacillus halodenitrificans]CDQ32066.1 Stage 0 sporulation protein KE [Virgibacillus halodenitrificans]
MGKEDVVSAVNQVSFDIKQGEILGLVGESGCGKTTMGKLLMKIEEITSGEILVNNEKILDLNKNRRKEFRKNVQMIFQDPFDSLNPKMTVYDIVSEPLISLKLLKNKQEIKQKVLDILQQVDLSPAEKYLNRHPHRLSGGQRQRIAIARALVVDPDFIVADEPVSMLDVSIRAGIMNLLKRINKERGVSILFITHDLATARFLCHRIAVMYLGEIKEILSGSELINNNLHPYTKLLLSSVPDLFEPPKKRLKLKGEATNAVVPPKGCRFAPRCPFAEDRCLEETQTLETYEDNHMVACWKAEQIKERKNLSEDEKYWLNYN